MAIFYIFNKSFGGGAYPIFAFFYHSTYEIVLKNYFIDPKGHILKVSCWYLNWKCVRKGGSRRGVLGGRWGFLTGDMEDRVIPDVMNDVYLPLGRYPENFVLISLLEWGDQEWGGTWRTLRVPEQRLGIQDHPWCHWWSYSGPRKMSWKFQVDIFIRSVSGRWGVK